MRIQRPTAHILNQRASAQSTSAIREASSLQNEESFVASDGAKDALVAGAMHQGVLAAPSGLHGGGRLAQLQVLQAQIATENKAVAGTVSSGKAMGPDGPARKEVSAFLAAYDAPRLGRPRERLLRWGAKVHELITETAGAGKDAAGVVDVMMDKDIRRQVFLLEGGLKFYQKRYGDPIRGQKEVAKALEDLLGAVKGANDYVKVGAKHHVPARVQKTLENDAKEARSELNALVKAHWMPDEKGQIPALKELVETLQATPWENYDADGQTLRSELARRLKKTEKLPYNMNELQGDVGIHELRRNLRWMPIYVEALDGAVQLDETRNPVKSYKKMLKTDLADSKFVRLPDAGHEAEPILISKSLYVANMDLVLKFGAIKDGGEAIEELAHAAVKSGVAEDIQEGEHLAAGWLGLKSDAFEDVSVDAAALFEKMNDKKLLKKMRKDVLDVDSV